MKSNLLRGAVAAILLGVSLGASAQFSGAYAPANWVTNHLPDADTDTGSVDIIGAPLMVNLLGSDNQFGDPSELRFTVTAAASGTYSFNWVYQTKDAELDPFQDPAGYIVGNAKFQLSDNSGGVSQSGLLSFAANTGDVIGFWVGTTDNLAGGASLTISKFTAPIPEPGAAVLMALGLAGLVLRRARRTR